MKEAVVLVQLRGVRQEKEWLMWTVKGSGDAGCEED